MVREASQVTCFGQDGHGIDRSDPGDGCQQLIVGQIRQQRDGAGFYLIALPNQAATLCENEAEHADGIRVRVDWKSN